MDELEEYYRLKNGSNGADAPTPRSIPVTGDITDDFPGIKYQKVE
jgi:hypothetical protein